MSTGGVLILVGLTLWLTATREEARVAVGVCMLVIGLIVKCAA